MTKEPFDGAGFGVGPGINGSPLGPSFREPPVRTPRRIGWIATAAAVGGALGIFLILIVIG
ncbi:hypothetical protein [Agromyces aerolatus]|uniref:hypothetical protein n=1 Tax=Agromyces sp. LY-1074 TaxID=3074080 RepID=UPI00285D9F73|nr:MULTISPECIES: hypothetical protein [unclassified Agromyces]MDR5698855.1 hypothetical protein [Agromyces sp. LY-1074]MDR5705367.1 hypothetical protein [Agromyces sp. LY-1358]